MLQALHHHRAHVSSSSGRRSQQQQQFASGATPRRVASPRAPLVAAPRHRRHTIAISAGLFGGKAAKPPPPAPSSPTTLPALLAAAKASVMPAAAISAAAAAGAAATFTPAQAVVGGLVLGVATVGKLALTGRILGVSGAVRGLARGDWSGWRVAFVAGLALGGAVAAGVAPGSPAFSPPPPPESYTLARAAAGGLLVGLGSALGSGCTSGHGICGLARLSKRSLAAVVTFMTTAALAARLTDAAAAAGVAVAKPAALAWPDAVGANQGALLLSVVVMATMGLVRAATSLVASAGMPPPPAVAASSSASTQQIAAASAAAAAAAGRPYPDGRPLALASELLLGTLFAFGLCYSGMTRPAKVLAFLSPGLPCWEPSLALVMAGALLVAAPGFRSIVRRRALAEPLCPGMRWSLPTATAVDAKLILGAALFGVGWGMTGICPGPAVVALAGAPSAVGAAFCAAMFGGMVLEGWIEAATAKSAPSSKGGRR
jgi:uncharacterized membrane protein YedE/YeeE